MKEPLKPLPTDCCGTGCRLCVYEIYEEQLDRYNNWKKQDLEVPTDRKAE